MINLGKESEDSGCPSIEEPLSKIFNPICPSGAAQWCVEQTVAVLGAVRCECDQGVPEKGVLLSANPS